MMMMMMMMMMMIIIREKLKINAVSGQLDDTFNEMLASKLN